MLSNNNIGGRQIKIEVVDIDELRHPKKNVRVHPKNQLVEMQRSIKLFGQIRPAIIDESNEILVGNGMVAAMRDMGIKTVEIMRNLGLTSKQKTKLMLADNRLSSMGYDNVNLLKEVLGELDGDLDIPGYEDSFLQDMFSQTNDTVAKMINTSSGYAGAYVCYDEIEQPVIEVTEDEFKNEPPENPKTKHGDIYLLGKHRLMCGDSTLVNDVKTLMNGQKARCVFTDPPWNVDYGSDARHPSWKPRQILNDKMSTDDFGAFLMSVFKSMKEVSESGCMTYIVMSAQEWGNLMNTLTELEYHWSSTIIWKKDSLVLSRKDYHTQYEPIWYGWLDGKRICPLKDRKQSDVWDIPRPKVSIEHPTMKPVELVARAITNSSKLHDPILDLFGGSGTTLIAAEQVDRMCYMMELDPKYCDVIVNRYINQVGDDGNVTLLRHGVEIPYSEVKDDE